MGEHIGIGVERLVAEAARVQGLPGMRGHVLPQAQWPLELLAALLACVLPLRSVPVPLVTGQRRRIGRNVTTDVARRWALVVSAIVLPPTEGILQPHLTDVALNPELFRTHFVLLLVSLEFRFRVEALGAHIADEVRWARVADLDVHLQLGLRLKTVVIGVWVIWYNSNCHTGHLA